MRNSNKDNKRRICVVVASRANYGRIKTAMQAIKDHPELELQLVVAASAMLERYGSAINVIRADGFEPDAVAHVIIEGENPTTMAKSTGLALIELSTILENLKPDVVLTVADRFETMATAVAASYMNIPLAHTQGGEVSGSIDESVRHAITRLAHIHFPATELAKERLIKMGEEPSTVHWVGCPAMDLAADVDRTIDQRFIERYSQRGVGNNVDFTKPYIVVLQHPVTTEYGSGLLFMSSPFSLESVDLLDRIGMEVWKIASGEVSNDVLLKRIIETGKPVILSSGMSSVEEMDRAVALLKAADISFAVLQCTSSYPSTADKVGMNMVPYFAERYQCVSGISDHSGTIFPSLAAASHGGQIFEIHVTMSPDMFGPDVPVSLTKQELRQLVDGVAFNREMLANPVDKDTLAKELEPMRSLFNKSIVAKQAIKAGTTISEEHLTLKKPGTGLSAKDISQVVGKRLNCDYEMDQMISLKDLS